MLTPEERAEAEKATDFHASRLGREVNGERFK